MPNGPAGLLEGLPLWLSGVVLLVVSLAAREAGALLRRSLKASSSGQKEPASEVQSYVIAAIFSLLAFTVGLCFSISLGRFEDRRGLVIEEANAIRTTYLRASLFDDPHRSRLQATLRQYARTRVAPDGVWDRRMDARIVEISAVRERLWAQTRDAINPIRQSELGTNFFDNITATLNVGMQRELAGQAQIPAKIVAVLFVYLVASAAVLGYVTGDGSRRHQVETTALLVLFSLMMTTMLDLDRPRAGGIQVPQKALVDLVATLERARP